ncbi:N-acetyl-gamma-glutamyl-phosphate reductase [Methanocaldococcus villosus KIN24-T80]|uniref:N-acetyl-gamma-glutamyl-phosphate reductase n=1 Tax=Methanocaldococcus villosus KIN24-T80 TaxID=1069083 RepID=N6UWM2_9EURY|nr:N-acetyl-gamma-glutamyl-phosphate reductase [Methanocaldococcus villosus]ENN96734.1 N-acetyl-gamma-glutamyl-phosphate reductase [Methanocaldococcus villosus KIN24-T80]
MDVAIVGASGYTGGELLRLLAFHKEANVVSITSRRFKGEKVYKVHPHLRKFYDLTFTEDVKDADVVFTALPHGTSMKVVPEFLERGMRVIDLSGDYRFEDLSIYEKYYKIKHTGLPNVKIVYGLTEIYREEIKKAQLISNPGCFPTGAILALYPLVKEGIIEENIIIDAKTGITGAGANPSERTHFPFVNEDIIAYNITTHRHKPEIEKELRKVNNKIKVSFVPHLSPINRGILTTIHGFLKEKIDNEELIEIYKKFYKNDIFIRIYKDIPKLSYVRGSNFCDIGGFGIDGKNLIVISAIDNLIKGASGQAIQNMNVMFGIDESEGLMNVPINP